MSRSPPPQKQIASLPRRSLTPLSGPRSLSAGLSKSRSRSPVQRVRKQKLRNSPGAMRSQRSPSPHKRQKLNAELRRMSRSVSRSPRPFKRRPSSRSPASRRHRVKSRSPLGFKRNRRHSPHSPGRRMPRDWSPENAPHHRFRGPLAMPLGHPGRVPIASHGAERFRFGPGSPSRFNDPYQQHPEALDPRWLEYKRALDQWYERMKLSIPSAGAEPFAPRPLPPVFANQMSPKPLKRSRSRSYSPAPKKHSSRLRDEHTRQSEMISNSKHVSPHRSKSRETGSKRQKYTRPSDDYGKMQSSGHSSAKSGYTKSCKTETSKKNKDMSHVEKVERKSGDRKRLVKESCLEYNRVADSEDVPTKHGHSRRRPSKDSATPILESVQTVDKKTAIVAKLPKLESSRKSEKSAINNHPPPKTIPLLSLNVGEPDTFQAKPINSLTVEKKQSKPESGINNAKSDEAAKSSSHKHRKQNLGEARRDLLSKASIDQDKDVKSPKNVVEKEDNHDSIPPIHLSKVESLRGIPFEVKAVVSPRVEIVCDKTIKSNDVVSENSAVTAKELPIEAVKEIDEIMPISKLPANAVVNEKPVLVANIPEKSKWERETDSDNDLKMRSKDRSRMAAEKYLMSK